MPTPKFEYPQGNPSPAQLQDFIVKLIRDLNFMLGNLDTLNVNRLDAKVIIADSITAGKLAANSVETDNLQAGAVKADKIDVAQLSAITADMGTLTAGSITTNAEINIGTDATVGNNLYVGNNDLTSGSKIYLNGAYIQSALGADTLTFGANGIITLTSLTQILLNCMLGNVSVISQNGTINDIVGEFNNVESDISTLDSTLSALSSVVSSLNSVVSSLSSAMSGKVNSGSSTSSTSVSDSHNHGIANGTQLLDADGVTVHTWVTYAGSPSHSHTV